MFVRLTPYSRGGCCSHGAQLQLREHIVRKTALDKADLQSAKHIELKNASHAGIQFNLLLPDDLVEENCGVYPRCVFNERWEIGTSGYVFEPDILRA